MKNEIIHIVSCDKYDVFSEKIISLFEGYLMMKLTLKFLLKKKYNLFLTMQAQFNKIC
jgi:hypothetical protein